MCKFILFPLACPPPPPSLLNTQPFFFSGNSGFHRSPTTFVEWYAAQPASYRNDGIAICPESIYYIPQLICKNFVKIYQPGYRMLAQPGPIRRVAAKSFNLPPERKGRNDKLPADAEEDLSHCQSYNVSENTVFNEVIRGNDPSNVVGPGEPFEQAQTPPRTQFSHHLLTSQTRYKLRIQTTRWVVF